LDVNPRTRSRRADDYPSADHRLGRRILIQTGDEHHLERVEDGLTSLVEFTNAGSYLWSLGEVKEHVNDRHNVELTLAEPRRHFPDVKLNNVERRVALWPSLLFGTPAVANGASKR
jgi:hypothetical protein